MALIFDGSKGAFLQVQSQPILFDPFEEFP